MPYTADFEIGTTVGGMLNLKALTTPVNYPKSKPESYAETRTLGDFSERGLGTPTVVWSWSALPQAQRDQLRVFCPGASATVFIKTRTLENTDTFRTYEAQMIWPSLEEERDMLYRSNFSITFRRLILQV